MPRPAPPPGKAFGDHIGPCDIDRIKRRARGINLVELIGGNCTDLADVAEDRVELPGVSVQLSVGQRKPGQSGQVRDLVTGYGAHG
ncbi:hypothetical protein MABM_24060 [Mycobacteroides abscessus]|nr:hypothetical protein MABM_24060 [Mycobacteroides abscessus]